MMRPIGKYIYLELPNKEMQTKSGLVVMDRRSFRDSRMDIGKVLAIGTETMKEAPEIHVGDYIVYNKMQVEVDGVPYHPEQLKGHQTALVSVNDVLAICNEPPEEYRI